jgi:RNA polymerase sigma-70 factor (ECF subfamily)
VTPPDAELIARVLTRDDRHAFATLVRRHQSAVRSLLRRLTCGDTALADDLAQETFLRAYRGLKGYRGGARLSTWLHRIAYNVFVSEVRRRKPEILQESLAEVAVANGGDRTHLKHDLLRAMAGLSVDERAALALAFGQDSSHREVAAILDCPLGTVKTHIARGKEKLKKRLTAYEQRGQA